MTAVLSIMPMLDAMIAATSTATRDPDFIPRPSVYADREDVLDVVVLELR